MKKKIISFVAISFMGASSLQAASFCPYHWYLALLAATETLVAYMPEARREVRILQYVGTGGIVAYVFKRAYDRAHSIKQEDEKSKTST